MVWMAESLKQTRTRRVSSPALGAVAVRLGKAQGTACLFRTMLLALGSGQKLGKSLASSWRPYRLHARVPGMLRRDNQGDLQWESLQKSRPSAVARLVAPSGIRMPGHWQCSCSGSAIPHVVHLARHCSMGLKERIVVNQGRATVTPSLTCARPPRTNCMRFERCM
jgi:hypothetical protein